MHQDASSQRKIPVQQRSVYQVVPMLIIILFTNAMSQLSLKLLSSSSSPLGPKSWINRCWVPWATWWSITSTAFTQPSHQRDPGNTDPPWMLFPTQTSMPASFSVFIFSNSFLPYDLPKGLRAITVFFTSNDYVKKNEWAQEVIGTVVFFSPPHH